MPLYGADSFLGWMDNWRRVAAKNVRDLVEDPQNALSKTLHASVDIIDKTMRDPMNFVGAGIAGTFIGPKSTLWNKEKALLAEQELLKGVDPKEVWKKTGTFKTPEGLEQEISDSKMRLRVDFNNLPRDVLGINRQTNFPLGGVVDHPRLYESYPEILRNTLVDELTKLMDWIPASSNTGSLHSGYGLVPAKISVRNKTEAGALNTFSHEFQHYIDEIEGRGRGANPGFTDEHFQEYLNNMSEARARLTANRRLLTEEERLATYPEFDRPTEDLVIGISNRVKKIK